MTESELQSMTIKNFKKMKNERLATSVMKLRLSLKNNEKLTKQELKRLEKIQFNNIYEKKQEVQKTEKSKQQIKEEKSQELKEWSIKNFKRQIGRKLKC